MNAKWAKARGQWVKRTAQHNAAIKAHKQARRTHDKSMTKLKVALNLEAKNTHRSCLDTHKDYQRLNADVQRNVRTRKEVYIATLIVACYAEFTNNAKAKVCQARKRRSNTSRWNIKPKSLKACASRTRIADLLGPRNWQPTYRNCAEHRRIAAEKAAKLKEKQQKERAVKERRRKENAAKERKVKERTSKERNAKARLERDRKHRQERASKHQERVSKERTNKERSAKESNNKAAARERAWKSTRLSYGQCCLFLHGCSSCCDKCPGGNHWVWPHVCGTSRRCNRL